MSKTEQCFKNNIVNLYLPDAEEDPLLGLGAVVLPKMDVVAVRRVATVQVDDEIPVQGATEDKQLRI